MAEVGIDISGCFTKDVGQFLNKWFDYLITVCGNAKKSCPIFSGKVINKIHIGIEDPAEVKGSDAEVLAAFRKTRDKIKNEFYNFYQFRILKKEEYYF
jgi:arsenate reductase